MKITDFLPTFGNKEPVNQPAKAKKKAVAKGFLGVGDDLYTPSSRLVDEKSASRKLLEANTGWVYANVSTIARSVSKIEFELYNIRLVGGQIEYVEIESHPFLDILDRFNSMTSCVDGIFLTQSHLELTGDAFWLVDGVGRNIKNIYIIDPTKITIQFTSDSGSLEITGYNYKDTIDGKAVDITYTPEQIIHFKVPNPANPVRGKSVVEAAATIIDTDNLAEAYNHNLFIRGAIQKFMLTTDKAIGQEDMDRLERKLQKNYSGVANSHKTLILSGGLQPAKINESNKDMEFSVQQQWARDKIANMFGNNKAVLGITDDVNRANAEATIDQWLKETIKPKMQRICDTLNEFLLPQFGTGLMVGFEDPAPENKQDKLTAMQTLYTNSQRPVISLNEAREEMGFTPTTNSEDDIIPGSADAPTPAPANTPSQGGNQDNQEEVPKALANVNYKSVLRRSGILDKQHKQKLEIDFDKSAKAVAKSLIKRPVIKEALPPVRRGSKDFTEAELLAYWKKIDSIAKSKEKALKEQVKRFLEGVEDKVMAVVATIETKGLKKAADYELFNLDDEVTSGISLFQPLLTEIQQLSGQEAYRLIKYFKQYKPTTDAHELMVEQTAKFTKSMLVTDKDRLLNTLVDAIKAGKSPAETSRIMRDTFGDIKKYQSDKIARTESLRAANMAADDAWQQSGMVEGKEWLTAGDPCPECEVYDGQVIELGGNFFDDEFSDGDPPLHPNCRCTIIPVISQGNEKELAELKDYVKELEGLLELDDE